jgi:hypothetical protein
MVVFNESSGSADRLFVRESWEKVNVEEKCGFMCFLTAK